MQETKFGFMRNTFNNGTIILLVLVLTAGVGAFAIDFAPDTLLKPTVTFTGAPASAPNGSIFTVTATTNDGTTATITAVGACSVSGDTVTITENSETCTLTATWPATATYASAKATQKTTATIGYNENIIDLFGSQNWPDGIAPQGDGLVFDTDGNLYTTVFTSGGTLNGDGAVVELSPQSGGIWKETVLYIFNREGTGFNGYHPVGTLSIDSKGNLYGTTSNGGTGNCSIPSNPPTVVGCGAVYELSRGTDGVWAATGLYSFQGSGTESSSGSGTDGFWPVAGVTLATSAATTLYGTTTCGGTGMLHDEGDLCGGPSGSGTNSNGAGTVYELTYTKTGGWKETVLYNFSGNGASNDGVDGWEPESALLLKSGKLYGTTCSGGADKPGTSGAGTVYELTPGTPWTETVLHSFNGTDGGCPMYGAPVMDSKDNLYGMANLGGTVANGGGTAWELIYSAGTYKPTATVLYNFGTQTTDGTNPSWGLVSYKGSWYGTTGGWNSGQFGAPYGTAFKLTYSATKGWQETILWTFNGESDTDIGGAGYNQLVVDKLGNFYGMAPFGPGGVAQGGGVFELSPK